MLSGGTGSMESSMLCVAGLVLGRVYKSRVCFGKFYPSLGDGKGFLATDSSHCVAEHIHPHSHPTHPVNKAGLQETRNKWGQKAAPRDRKSMRQTSENWCRKKQAVLHASVAETEEGRICNQSSI